MRLYAEGLGSELNITIFGASGRIGRIVTRYALGHGDTVTAYIRDRNGMDRTHPRLKVIIGELSNQDLVEQAISGADVVISTLGPDMEMKRTRKGTPIADGHEMILTAMKKYGKKRLITLGTPTIRAKEDSRNITTLLPGPMAKVLYPAAYQDMRRLGQVIAQSDLEWTVVRIIHLTNRHSGRTYGITLGERPAGITVSRENVARFIYETARKNQFIRRMPIVFDKGIPLNPVRARSPVTGCC
ncbi:MAG TPA: NAD(P)H-binding protein [Clostridiaceae bacterium]|nr:NAD(P)H-binding protein [Clostridiaceae bacterium]